MEPKVSYEITACIIGIARNAGYIIKTAYRDPKKLDTRLKADASVVTMADRAIHRLALDSMAREFPDIPVIGEEGSSAHKDAKKGLWINIDEVDGTGALTLGVPTSLVMIALMDKSQPIYSAIYNPFGNRMYVAQRGFGAHCNGITIRVKSPSNRGWSGLPPTGVQARCAP